MQEPQQPATQLAGLVNGYRVSQAIHAAVVLGIPDLLADGPRGSDELATAAGADADTLYRLLRALASVGVLHEDDGRRFELTALGAPLRSDAPDSIAGWAAFIGRPHHWEAWGALTDSVRTGENAFRRLHGIDVWEYRAQHPEEGAVFDRAMTDLSRGATAALLDAYDFGRFGTVVDVAGGRGALLAALLARYPALRGVLFDQEHVVASAGDILDAAGVADRCRVVAGSFFDGVPEGGDAYLMKAIIHDWEDEEAVAILRACRRAVPPDGALLVVERRLGPANELPDAKLSDLTMFVAPGGRERSDEEYATLFAAGGFRLERVVPTRGALSVFEASPA